MGELIPWLSDSAASAPENVRSFRFTPEQLRDVSTRQRSLYRATICLILASSGIDDHPIFPAKHLDDRDVDSRLRDCVLNRCLIDSHTNQGISCRAPSIYMAELWDEPGFPMETVLTSHLIPYGAESGLWTDDFERFLAQRQELVGAAIAQAPGATHEKPALVR